MRTLVAGVVVAVLGCAPSIQSRVSSGNSASMASAAAELQRTARMMETAKRECAAARLKGLSAEEEAAASQRMLTQWLAPAKPEQKPRETRPDARVTKLGESLAPHAAAPGVNWVFLVEESAEVDSFSVPGATVLVTRGLLELATSDAELAGAVAHEMAHVRLRHQLGTLAEREEVACGGRRYAELWLADEASRGGGQSSNANVAMRAAADGSLGSSSLSMTAGMFGKKQQAGPQQELDADAAAARTLHAAGLDAAAFIALIPKFAATSTPMLDVSKRIAALEAVRASLPPLKPVAPAKPAAPVKKPKR